jgi:hypothetical protein
MNKTLLSIWAKDAVALNAKLDSILRDINKIPSYNGKAAFYDKVLIAKAKAHNLAFSLRYDADDAR